MDRSGNGIRQSRGIQALSKQWLFGIAIGAAFLLLAAPAFARAAAGTLDPSFGGDGKVVTDFGKSDQVAATAIDSQGRITAVGDSIGDSWAFALSRYMPNGRLDHSFGGDGKVVTHWSGAHARATSMALDSQGRIVAAGEYLGAGRTRIAVARYLPNGNLDPTFGDGGEVTTGPSGGAVGVAVDPQGKIVVAGTRGSYGNNGFVVVRYLPNGDLDPSFGGDGKVLTDGSRAWPNSLAISPKGRITVGGAESSDFEVLRYLPTGDLDPSFGGDGKVVTDFGGGDDAIASAVLDGQGRIVAAGRRFHGDTETFALARYLSNGSLDDSFSGNGKTTTGFEGNSTATDVAIDSQGRIVAGGIAGTAKQTFAVARYKSAGRLDPSFGGDGKVTTAFGANAIANSVSIDSLDRVVAAGQAGDDFGLTRYIGSP